VALIDNLCVGGCPALPILPPMSSIQARNLSIIHHGIAHVALLFCPHLLFVKNILEVVKEEVVKEEVTLL